jgi:hypothetical protein
MPSSLWEKDEVRDDGCLLGDEITPNCPHLELFGLTGHFDEHSLAIGNYRTII